MNFIRPLFAAMLLVMITASVSFGGKTAVPAARDLNAVLKECIKYPPQAYAKCCEGTLTVRFVINEEGKIVVKSVKCDENASPEMVECIKKQLSELDVKNIKSPYNQHYQVKFTFKIV